MAWKFPPLPLRGAAAAGEAKEDESWAFPFLPPRFEANISDARGREDEEVEEGWLVDAAVMPEVVVVVMAVDGVNFEARSESR